MGYYATIDVYFRFYLSKERLEETDSDKILEEMLVELDEEAVGEVVNYDITTPIEQDYQQGHIFLSGRNIDFADVIRALNSHIEEYKMGLKLIYRYEDEDKEYRFYGNKEIYLPWKLDLLSMKLMELQEFVEEITNDIK